MNDRYLFKAIDTNFGAEWDLYVKRSSEMKVIDNIFDNKELLESEEK